MSDGSDSLKSFKEFKSSNSSYNLISQRIYTIITFELMPALLSELL